MIGEYHAQLVRVVDGDTLYLSVALGFNISIVVDIRLARINAPERDAPGGAEATAYLTTLVTNCDLILRSNRKDKYGRWVGEIVTSAGVVSDLMLKAGRAEAF